MMGDQDVQYVWRPSGNKAINYKRAAKSCHLLDRVWQGPNACCQNRGTWRPGLDAGQKLRDSLQCRR